MSTINNSRANSSVQALANSAKMLDNINLLLNERKVYYHNRFNGIKTSLYNAIKRYNIYIAQLNNSIIYVEVQDENGNKHIESPNAEEVYAKINVYSRKIDECYNLLSNYDVIYKEYYNNIERAINTSLTKIKNGKEYLLKLAKAQNKYLEYVTGKKEDISYFEENTNTASISNASSMSNAEIIDMLNSEATSSNIVETHEYAMEQLKMMSKVGGSYDELKALVKSKGLGYLLEVHHVPPRSSAQIIEKRISKNMNGKTVIKDISPAIIITKKDHIKTASYGSSKTSFKYQKMQKELVESGNYTKAYANEIKDIRTNFGNKYDRQLRQVEDYIGMLQVNEKID